MWGVWLSVPDPALPNAHAVTEHDRAPHRAVVFGAAGTALTTDERAFFRDADPLGFILFRRNCDTPEQVRALVAEMRAAVGRADAPVLIDQEGGRVAPHAPAALAGLSADARVRRPRGPRRCRRAGGRPDQRPAAGADAGGLRRDGGLRPGLRRAGGGCPRHHRRPRLLRRSGPCGRSGAGDLRGADGRRRAAGRQASARPWPGLHRQPRRAAGCGRPARCAGGHRLRALPRPG
ncbi:protein of unknown function (plasmid) [Azospirillum baldaniorum]|uniref:Glycoside hydrolase family 3 N-terminal domain-containing protein n=1 Tax=Azospirillum baldaniorum TaxID=1064539 RepID=A0A9P1JU18_9PROT|nr:protein of unknown function [Azospirillum baldaniorum]